MVPKLGTSAIKMRKIARQTAYTPIALLRSAKNRFTFIPSPTLSVHRCPVVRIRILLEKANPFGARLFRKKRKPFFVSPQKAFSMASSALSIVTSVMPESM